MSQLKLMRDFCCESIIHMVNGEVCTHERRSEEDARSDPTHNQEDDAQCTEPAGNNIKDQQLIH